MHPCIIDALQQMTVYTLTHNLKAVNRHTAGRGGKKERKQTNYKVQGAKNSCAETPTTYL